MFNALSTIAALVPLLPSCPMSSGTVWAGVQMTATSGTSGKEATSGHAARPPTSAWR